MRENGSVLLYVNGSQKARLDLTMAHTRTFKGEHQALSLSMLPSSRRSTGVVFMALCPQVVSQSPQHFRASEIQATFDGFFARQSVCSVISLHSGMSRAVQLHCHANDLPSTEQAAETKPKQDKSFFLSIFHRL